mmetsp:Transcript_3818/g.9928  ORF Transcript_3818/g.9928 Transcript_3818/m.9928 type:complete len:285 (-) Transcript_3818:1749-2603(-)
MHMPVWILLHVQERVVELVVEASGAGEFGLMRGKKVEQLVAQHRASNQQSELELRGLLHPLEGVCHHSHQEPHEQRETHDGEHRVVEEEDGEIERLRPGERLESAAIQVWCKTDAEDGHIVHGRGCLQPVFKRRQRLEDIDVGVVGGSLARKRDVHRGEVVEHVDEEEDEERRDVVRKHLLDRDQLHSHSREGGLDEEAFHQGSEVAVARESVEEAQQILVDVAVAPILVHFTKEVDEAAQKRGNVRRDAHLRLEIPKPSEHLLQLLALRADVGIVPPLQDDRC